MTAYVLIDFENVQPDKMGHLGDGAFRFKVLVGAKQTRVPYEMTQALQPLGTAVEWVKIAGSGRNALDLHIAYMIGRLSVEEPGSVFHIVSKDTDYDPLIAYLKQNKIVCHRWAAVTDIPHPRQAGAKAAPVRARARSGVKAAAKPAAAAPPDDRVAEIADNLSRRTRGLPATLKALASTVKAHFRGVGVTDSEVDSILIELERRGLVGVKDGKVSYRLGRS